MSEKAKYIETRTATIFHDKNGIVIITMKDCGEIDELDVLDTQLVLRHLTNGEAAYKIFDARGDWSMNKKAEEASRKGDSARTTAARAIVMRSGIKAALLKFLQSFGKNDYPQKFFSDWDEAYAWLLEQKKSRS